MSTTRYPVHPSLKHAESPTPRAVVAATIACAVSRVRGPTTGTLSNRNAGGKADPDPLPPILAVGPALAGLVRLTSMLALSEGPHLVELPLGHRQMPQQVLVKRCGLMGRTTELCQHGLCRHAKRTADACQINLDPEHLEGHHNLLFRGAKIAKDCLAGLKKCTSHV